MLVCPYVALLSFFFPLWRIKGFIVHLFFTVRIKLFLWLFMGRPHVFTLVTHYRVCSVQRRGVEDETLFYCQDGRKTLYCTKWERWHDIGTTPAVKVDDKFFLSHFIHRGKIWSFLTVKLKLRVNRTAGRVDWCSLVTDYDGYSCLTTRYLIKPAKEQVFFYEIRWINVLNWKE